MTTGTSPQDFMKRLDATAAGEERDEEMEKCGGSGDGLVAIEEGLCLYLVCILFICVNTTSHTKPASMVWYVLHTWPESFVLAR